MRAAQPTTLPSLQPSWLSQKLAAAAVAVTAAAVLAGVPGFAPTASLGVAPSSQVAGARWSLGVTPAGARWSLGATPYGARWSLRATPAGARWSLGVTPAGARWSLGATPAGARWS